MKKQNKRKKQNKKCYIVTYAEANNVSYDLSYEVFETEDDAVKGMEEFMNNKFQEYEYGKREIEKIKNNSTWDYCEDDEGEWYVRIDIADFKEHKNNNEPCSNNDTNKPSVEDIMDWIMNHDELYESFKAYFDSDNPDIDSIIDWLIDHDTAYEDFKMYFNLEDDDLQNLSYKGKLSK